MLLNNNRSLKQNFEFQYLNAFLVGSMFKITIQRYLNYNINIFVRHHNWKNLSTNLSDFFFSWKNFVDAQMVRLQLQKILFEHLNKK